MKNFVIIPALAFALSGCFFVTKKPAQSSSSQPSTVQPKNHGQERSQEVHERNAERKAEHDADKGKK